MKYMGLGRLKIAEKFRDALINVDRLLPCHRSWQHHLPKNVHLVSDEEGVHMCLPLCNLIFHIEFCAVQFCPTR